MQWSRFNFSVCLLCSCGCLLSLLHLQRLNHHRPTLCLCSILGSFQNYCLVQGFTIRSCVFRQTINVLGSADFTPTFLSRSFGFSMHSHPKDYLCLSSHLPVGSHCPVGLSRSIQPNFCWQVYEFFGENLCLISKRPSSCVCHSVLIRVLKSFQKSRVGSPPNLCRHCICIESPRFLSRLGNSGHSWNSVKLPVPFLWSPL